MSGEGEKCFLVEYNHGGKKWCGPDVYAESWEDAERKLQSLKTNGRVVGELVTRISVPGPLERLFRRLTGAKA